MSYGISSLHASTDWFPRHFAVLEDLSRSERASTHWSHLNSRPSQYLRRSERPAADLMTDETVGMRGSINDDQALDTEPS
ncbi:hypothetical protein CABS01_01505 [Colletotrichum abscissum]|uniref:Uncharacterized protein n=1 Tax=Colletotrichum abscissum TaxID=1671311 RepID=A0A9P9XCN9_9PEZI|nr:uncharacterized protein CABS01_01505 [Colletotrichum abscissum]KAI3548282.1 hypothetical protein CABS02_08400 [Colletotrichum abscissum]KAK1495698.1 hypothetical protein CABS01_01505 [Colletotrichum abscissum]